MVLAAVGWSNLGTAAFTDYETEAQPAITALEALDVGAFLDHAPAYGGGLLLESPGLVLQDVFGGGLDGAFRAIAVPGLLALGLLALWLWSALAGQSRPRAAWLALLVCVASPAVGRALYVGHPEEILGGVLVAAAALAAVRDRPGWCGVLLGLALVNKAWAIVAVLPILMILERQRVLCALVFVPIAVAGWLPFLLGRSDGVAALSQSGQDAGPIFQPWQLFWFFGAHKGDVTTPTGVHADYRTPPDWIAPLTHPLVVAMPLLVACGLLALRYLRRQPVTPADGLGLLVVALLLRQLLDTWNTNYYAIPVVLAMLVWETMTRDRLPVVSAAVAGLASLTMTQTRDWLSPDLQSAVYLAWMVPLLLWFLWRTFCPERAAEVSGRWTDRWAAAAPRVLALARERAGS